jgi:murein DD-endopeptidase MepM/ murein hydrolase activator NlpD
VSRVALLCLALLLLGTPSGGSAPALARQVRAGAVGGSPVGAGAIGASPVGTSPRGGSPAGLGAIGAVRTASTATAYVAPVEPLRVLRPFEPPPTPYAAGHRGVDLASAPRQLVRAAADGTVAFSGEVASRGVLVLQHADGVRTEYEPVVPLVTGGSAVRRGEPIARVSGAHGTCPPGGCLHWGARRGAGYFDPLSLLRPLGPVRLLPWR